MSQALAEVVNDLLANAVQLLLAAAIALLGIYLRKFMQKQRHRDEEQDRRDAEFEQKLASLAIRVNYFEKERFAAYKEIRKLAQRARDQVRLIEKPEMIAGYDSWIRQLFDSYEQILEILHENALLLEHFRHYEYLHRFKNVLLDFCLAARQHTPEHKEGCNVLMEKLNDFTRSYEALVAHIKFPSDFLDLPNKQSIKLKAAK